MKVFHLFVLTACSGMITPSSDETAIVPWNLQFWQRCFGGFKYCGRWHNVTAQNTQILVCVPITEYLNAV